tara:strand:+ start:196 stop:621 length:426 start_codon:yes stop_codon:yes gene_type:complete
LIDEVLINCDAQINIRKEGNMHKTFILGLVFLISLAGCATPVSHENIAMQTYDQNTEYSISEHPKGYTITVFYSRYQFIPESDAVATACKAALTSIGWEVADKQGKEIKSINEQRIKVSMGRNGLTGITSCQASVLVEWQK